MTGQVYFDIHTRHVLAAAVEYVSAKANPELTLRLEEPAPGTAHVSVAPMGGQVYLTMRVFLYGDRADAVAERDGPRWQAWMNAHFPMVAEVSPAD